MRKTSLFVFITFFMMDSLGEISCGADDSYTMQRKQMIEEQIIQRGVADPLVLKALEKVERHLFVPDSLRDEAYTDDPLPIGYGQTISQPYIVAFMTEAAQLDSDDKVLEVGTGSGYQAAILAEIVKELYSIEILEPLSESAGKKLKDLGYQNVFVKQGDGYQGWVEHAPFDAIIVTAAPAEMPEELVRQLKPGGRMVIPIGSFYQELYRITKTEKGIQKEKLIPVRFVPMIKGEER